jgi:hypothetical protein
LWLACKRASHKNDPDIRKLPINKACFAFLESKAARYEMSRSDDFEFRCGDMIRQGEDAEKLLIQ